MQLSLLYSFFKLVNTINIVSGTVKIKEHETAGCSMCVTANGCTESSDRVCSCKWHHQGQLKADYSFELGIREKALAMETHFPNPDVSMPRNHFR